MLEIIKIIVCISIGFCAYRYMKIKENSQVTKFVFWLVFIRFTAASLHSITYVSIAGPISLISLISMISVVASAVYLLKLNCRVFFNRHFMLIKLIIVLMLISALINNHILASVASVVKWLFLLQLIWLIHYCFKYDGVKDTLRILGLAYSYPVVMLLFSVLLGVKKATELDGSLSYLGGFYHESVFSNMIYGALLIYVIHFVISQNYSMTKLLPSLFFIFFLTLLVNYRTTVIASAVVVIAVIYSIYNKQSIQLKALSLVSVVIATLLASFVDLTSTIERFEEIPQAVSRISTFISLPEYYSMEDKKFFSGRIYLWSQYISEAMEGSVVRQWFGLGMDSWKSVFRLYAHNTIVSFYYELGLIGVFLISALFINYIMYITRISDKGVKWLMLGIYLSFLVLNFGTMPLWQIEGIIIYALVIATITYYSEVKSNVT